LCARHVLGDESGDKQVDGDALVLLQLERVVDCCFAAHDGHDRVDLDQVVIRIHNAAVVLVVDRTLLGEDASRSACVSPRAWQRAVEPA